MTRISRLCFADGRSDPSQPLREEGELLYSCPDGVPVLWVFAFGGRNVWNPGDDVQARGGAVGQRLRFETPVEVALTRLEQAEDALRPLDSVWPWYAAVPMFRRKLSLKPKTGFLRLHAPWVETLPESEAFAWKSATAFAENFVNFHAAGQPWQAMESLRRLRSFCPFLAEGHGEDWKAFEACVRRGAPREVELALLTLGEPDQRDIFEAGARRDIAPALDALERAPRLPRPVPPAAAASASSAPAPSGDGASGGVLAKLTGLFRRR